MTTAPKTHFHSQYLRPFSHLIKEHKYSILSLVAIVNIRPLCEKPIHLV